MFASSLRFRSRKKLNDPMGIHIEPYCIGRVSRYSEVTKQMVLAAACDHLEKKKRAYPDTQLRHKDHQSVHIGLQWEKTRALKCFTPERKHGRYKDAQTIAVQRRPPYILSLYFGSPTSEQCLLSLSETQAL